MSPCRVTEGDGKERTNVFGHMGLGGSLAMYDPDTDVAIAVTVNKLTLEREFSQTVVNHVAQQLGIGVLIALE